MAHIIWSIIPANRTHMDPIDIISDSPKKWTLSESLWTVSKTPLYNIIDSSNAMNINNNIHHWKSSFDILEPKTILRQKNYYLTIIRDRSHGVLILKSCISQEKEIQEKSWLSVWWLGSQESWPKTSAAEAQPFFVWDLVGNELVKTLLWKKNASWSCENGSKKNSMDYESKILVKNVNFETGKNRAKLTVFLNGISSLTQQHFAYFS